MLSYTVLPIRFVTLGCGRQQSGEQQSLLNFASATLKKCCKKSSSIEQSSDSDEDDDDGFAGDRDKLRNSASSSSRYGSVNIGHSPVVSTAEVSVA